MSSDYRIRLIFTPILLALAAVASLLGALRPSTHAAPLSPLAAPEPTGVFHHIHHGRRLHQIHPTGQFAAPDADWTAAGDVIKGPYTATQATALRPQNVALFRTTVQDEIGQDVGWELGDVERILNDLWQQQLPYTVLTETQLISQLNSVDILILPSFKTGYHQQVSNALSPDALQSLHQFVQDGGTVYAQGNAGLILEAADIIAIGTFDPDTPLSLPPNMGDVGTLVLHNPQSPLFFNWLTPSLYLLQDPLLTLTGNLEPVASYSDTLGGPQPAIVEGTLGQGRILLVNGHPTAVNQEGQHLLFFNALLQNMSEKGELVGRAIQVYTDTVPGNVIPVYEPVPISVTLTFSNYWSTAVLSNVVVTERVQVGFNVVLTTIVPAPDSVLITTTNGITETIITWNLGAVYTQAVTLHYQAMTEIETLTDGSNLFSTGSVTYIDGLRSVNWQHTDFLLFAAIAADLKGDHDNEPDRFHTIPADGLYLDEHIWLENVENTPASDVCIVRYVPLVTPIVGLEDQRQPLATNAGETVWMRNAVYGYREHQLPIGMNSYTETWDIDTHWDGSTVITMTTPGGYHADPLPAEIADSGFFITIPPTYTHAITLTDDHQLRLPAVRLEWCIGDFPAFWYELPAIRYGIHSSELFSRSVSFTGDPMVDTIVVNAKGGSVYTGAGADHLMVYRQFLPEAAMVVYTPPAPTDAGLVYQDIWGRSHTSELRGNFYDVFSYASCACGPYGGERNAALNMSYGIWVDTDGDGNKETVLTDFSQLKGVMPTRLVGDLEITIKSINYGRGMALTENVLETGIFRGLGFTIQPRYDTWEDSYSSTYSTIVSNTRQGAYDFLIFQQEIPPQATNLITIHATIDPTNNPIEGLLQLNQGARLVYRQSYAGEGQYELYDSRTQVAQGVRTDTQINSTALPSKISTYSDTTYLVHQLSDAYDWQTFDQDPYFTSYGYGDAVASVYVGGRDQRELLHSIIELGDRTWVRVELNNNTGTLWNNIELDINVPAGLTATQLFQEDVPIDLWPDIPYLNATQINDASFGLYFFELQTNEALTALLGTLHQLPITFTADGAPANFTVPPAIVAIRTADGDVPRYVSGETIALAMHDSLPDYVTAEDIRLLTDGEWGTLQEIVNADTAVIPNTDNAITYYQSITATIPFTTLNGQLIPELEGLGLPWLVAEDESALNVVVQTTVAVSRSARYAVNSGTAVTYTDSFGLDWYLQAPSRFVNAVGASLQTTYNLLTITNLSTGEIVTSVVPNSWNQVELEVTLENSGTDIAAEINQMLEWAGEIELITAPTNVITTEAGLLWDVGDLGPGANRTVAITFHIFVPNTPPIQDGIRVIDHTDADFINLYAGKRIVAQTGQDFYLPVSNQINFSNIYLPIIQRRPIQSRPDLVITQLSVVDGELLLTIANIGQTAVHTPFWVDLYINPTVPPQTVNEIWTAVGTEGIAWSITDTALPLQPNQTLTLTIGDSYYQADRSHFPSLGIAGLPIYAQVDSYNPQTNHGAVLESHELNNGTYNNITTAVTQ